MAVAPDFFLRKIRLMSGIMIIFVVKLDAAVAQLVEHQLPKLRVASSSLVCRSNIKALYIRNLMMI